MQTVTFQCGVCRKTMGVGEDLLGKRVRCPHCQQVILAPVRESLSPVTVQPEPTFAAPGQHDVESIFGSPEEGSEDVFGHAPETPKLEMPPGPSTWPNPAASPSSPAAPSNTPADNPAVGNQWSSPGNPALEGGAILSSESARNLLGKRARQDSLFTLYVLIFLIPYALVMTFATIWFYTKLQQQSDPWEKWLDYPSDNTDPYKRLRERGEHPRLKDDGPLPAQPHVPLGQSREFGDLLVTPQKVERRPIQLVLEKDDKNIEDSRDQALVLTLQVKNVSTDLQFAPNDLCYNRAWKKDNPPYTALEVGGERFYGGPNEWWSLRRNPAPRRYVQGQQHDKMLEPGQEMEMIVCTNPKDPKILSRVNHYDGPLLWRVQLRRGLVKFRDRELTATVIFGVEFEKNDIR